MSEVGNLKRLLQLQPHPQEGGFFVETYRASSLLPEDALGAGYRGERALGTAIYYLLTPNSFSALHRLPGDEIFHFYLGDPVEMLLLGKKDTGKMITLGTDIEVGMRPQVMVPGGVWQGSRVVPGGRYALLGATMSPGFDFADYQAGAREELARQYPERVDLIKALTR